MHRSSCRHDILHTIPAKPCILNALTQQHSHVCSRLSWAQAHPHHSVLGFFQMHPLGWATLGPPEAAQCLLRDSKRGTTQGASDQVWRDPSGLLAFLAFPGLVKEVRGHRAWPGTGNQQGASTKETSRKQAASKDLEASRPAQHPGEMLPGF